MNDISEDDQPVRREAGLLTEAGILFESEGLISEGPTLVLVRELYELWKKDYDVFLELIRSKRYDELSHDDRLKVLRIKFPGSKRNILFVMDDLAYRDLPLPPCCYRSKEEALKAQAAKKT